MRDEDNVLIHIETWSWYASYCYFDIRTLTKNILFNIFIWEKKIIFLFYFDHGTSYNFIFQSMRNTRLIEKETTCGF